MIKQYTFCYDLTDEGHKSVHFTLNEKQVPALLINHFVEDYRYWVNGEGSNKIEKKASFNYQQKLFKHTYEVQTGKVVPYFDVEKYYPFTDEKSSKKLLIEHLTYSLSLLKKHFPNGKFYILNSSGRVKKNGEFQYKISYHILVRGVGYLNSGIGLEKFLDKNEFPYDFDRSVYKNEGKTQLFRTIYSCKMNDDRELKPIELMTNEDGSCDIKNLCIIPFSTDPKLNVMNYLITNYYDEKTENGDISTLTLKYEPLKTQKTIYDELNLYKLEKILKNIPNKNEGVNKGEFLKILSVIKYEVLCGSLPEDKTKDLFVSWAKQSKKSGTILGAEYRWNEASPSYNGEINTLGCLLKIAKKYNKEFKLRKMELIDTRIYQGDDGLSKIFLEEIEKDDIVAVNKNEIYVYNKEKELFEKKNEQNGTSCVSNIITNVLVKYIQRQIESFKHYNCPDMIVEKNRLIQNPDAEEAIENLERIMNEDNEEEYDEDEEDIIDRKKVLKDKMSNDKQFKKKLEQTQKILESVRSYDKCMKIYKKMLDKITDINFSKKLNQEAYLLPVKCISNGQYYPLCIDLKTGLTIDRKKSHYFSTELDIDYDWKKAETYSTKKVEDFVSQVFNKRVIPIFRQLLGYMFINKNHLKKLFIFYGASGDNAKSKVIKLFFENILGSFHTSVNQDLFIKASRSSGQAEAYYKTLQGKRVGVLSETSNDKCDNAKVKRLTGGDKLTYRNLFSTDEEEMICLIKFILNSNKLLGFDEDDPAFFRRICLIIFDNKFVLKTDQDKKDRTQEEFDNDKKDILERRKRRDDWLIEENKKGKILGFEYTELTDKQKLKDECEDMLMERKVYDADETLMNELEKDKLAFFIYSIKCCKEFINQYNEEITILPVLEEYKRMEMYKNSSIHIYINERTSKWSEKEKEDEIKRVGKANKYQFRKSATEMYKSYGDWCKEYSYPVKTSQEFGQTMKDYYQSTKSSGIYYEDIKILNNFEKKNKEDEDFSNEFRRVCFEPSFDYRYESKGKENWETESSRENTEEMEEI